MFIVELELLLDIFHTSIGKWTYELPVKCVWIYYLSAEVGYIIKAQWQCPVILNTHHQPTLSQLKTPFEKS